jgi:putative sigma-54 modulation protein
MVRHILSNCRLTRTDQFKDMGGSMNVDIQSNGLELNDELREHTLHRLQGAMAWASDDVETIHVRLSHVNRYDRCHTTRCMIQISLSHKPVVVIEDNESDLYLAVDRAVDRIERVMSRKFGRSRNAESHWFEHKGWQVKRTRSGKVHLKKMPSSEQNNRLAGSRS